MAAVLHDKSKNQEFEDNFQFASINNKTGKHFTNLSDTSLKHCIDKSHDLPMR